MALGISLLLKLLTLQAVATAVIVHRMTAMGFIDLGAWAPPKSGVFHQLALLAGLVGGGCGHQPRDSFVVVSSRVVLPDGVRPAALAIAGGRIAGVATLDGATDLAAAAQAAFNSSSEAVEDFGSLVISPGIVDIHVHINEPGRVVWEGFETATSAAAAGGITTMVDMPLNSLPCTITAEFLRQKLDASKGKLHVDVGMWGGLTPQNSGDPEQLQGLLDAGALGFKCFLSPSGNDNEFPNASRSDVEAGLEVLRRAGAPLLAHAEIVSHIDVQGDKTKYETYLHSRPRSFEKTAVRMLLEVMHQGMGKPAAPGFGLHVVHLTDSDLLPELAVAKSAGVPVTVEVGAHYLVFAAEDIPDGDTHYKCAPPLRERKIVNRLWGGLQDGSVDIVASDHSPSTPDVKLFDTGDFLNSWGGFAGLQYSLPAVWNGSVSRGIGPERLAQWLSERPAAIAGLQRRKGRLAVGLDADLLVWDPEALADTSSAGCFHKHKTTTAFRDTRLMGRVKATFVRGQLVFQDTVLPATRVSKNTCGSMLLRGRL